MPELSLQQMVLFVSVGLFTLAAAFSDFRARKIPNRLTLPMFGVGWVYQLSFFGFFGLSGLGDGALAFLLGFRMTLLVLVSSTLIVVVGTMLIILGSVLSQGVWRTKSRFVAESPAGNTPNPQVGETIQGRQQRRIMAYAIPVAIATWAVMIWKLPLM